MTNRKPADRLHDVRETIRALREEEAELRAGMISGELELEGDEFTVTIETKVNERIDLKAMRKSVPDEIWRPYLVTSRNDRDAGSHQEGRGSQAPRMGAGNFRRCRRDRADRRVGRRADRRRALIAPTTTQWPAGSAEGAAKQPPDR
jgi:hypothetical protein